MMKLTAAVMVFLVLVPTAAFAGDLLDFGDEISEGVAEADAMDREQPGEGGEEIVELYLGEIEDAAETRVHEPVL